MVLWETKTKGSFFLLTALMGSFNSLFADKGMNYSEFLEFKSERTYDSACFGSVGGSLTVECGVGKHFDIHGIFYGMKNDSKCPLERGNASTSKKCCQPEEGDCFLISELDAFSGQIQLCGNKPQCQIQAIRVLKSRACYGVNSWSHTQFVVAVYSCFQDGPVTDTSTAHETTTIGEQRNEDEKKNGPGTDTTAAQGTTTIGDPRHEIEKKSDDGPIIGAVVGVLISCIIFVAILVFVIWRRRKRKLSQSAREYIQPARGKAIHLNAENSFDEIQKETLNSDSHVQNQKSGDSKTGYKMSVPADYSYTKIMKVSGIDAGDEGNEFVLSEPTAPTINDDYSLAKIESTDDYSLAKPIDNIKTSKLPEQDHYGYSHMPGLEKQTGGNNEDYGKLMDSSASSADDYGYSHMGDKRNVNQNDSSSPYQHGINAMNEEHDNYGYSHMTN